jgi:hypothetical protein
MGEEKAYETFCKLRWAAKEGSPVCPRCGSVEYYNITRGRRFKCAACRHQFSATSGTIFSSRKMTFTDLLTGLCLFANAVKGVSSLQFARDMGCNAKTGLRPVTGMLFMPNSIPSASIIRLPTASTAFTRITSSPISPVCAAWCRASTTLSARAKGR